jgi:hypothetical protein
MKLPFAMSLQNLRLVSGCESDEVVDLQEQGSGELSEKKLFRYHRDKIEEYKWRHKTGV